MKSRNETAASEAGAAAVMNASASTSANGMKVIVVIVEDQDVQDLVRAYFRPRNFEVISFQSAKQALAECDHSGRSWNVLISDFEFPEISSVEFTLKLKDVLPELPIIFLAPPELAEKAVEVIKHGAYDLVMKPLQLPQLMVAVERALHLTGLKGDLVELREHAKTPSGNRKGMIGRSPAFLQALDIAKRVATSTANILISGESGTGKEVFARYVHKESGRSSGPFVAINCSAIPEGLLESELFGHAKGSFTGAQTAKVGLFEEAHDGTLFLDEIGDLSLLLQAKLLRVLQDKTIRRVGENHFRTVNCRIISATHKDLSREVLEGRFREDLFFRLNVIPLNIPPLRDRPEDLVPLAEAFLRKFALENNSPAKHFSKEATKFILANTWRGNVRELENSIERAVVLSDGPEIGIDDVMPVVPLWASAADATKPETMGQIGTGDHQFAIHYGATLPTLDQVMQSFIEFAVQRNDGARDKTAKEIGIDRKTLYKRMKSELKV
ncbi:MAG: sigma-54 dependent transcriptional regulator [Bdellovibrionales bacterium]|nr:sigma-54 dependent transcriptional regulator [Bdellovibrionales bacterium]